jgi:RNA polymerase-binding transcription factor DksA
MVGEEQAIKEIQDALDRIEQGTFGRCEACGGNINRDRLRALPQSRYCIRCAEEVEEKMGH